MIKNQVKQQWGSRLRKARKDILNIKQRTLADYLGVEQPQISRWESGQGPTEKGTKQKIVSFLKNKASSDEEKNQIISLFTYFDEFQYIKDKLFPTILNLPLNSLWYKDRHPFIFLPRVYIDLRYKIINYEVNNFNKNYPNYGVDFLLQDNFKNSKILVTGAPGSGKTCLLFATALQCLEAWSIDEEPYPYPSEDWISNHAKLKEKMYLPFIISLRDWAKNDDKQPIKALINYLNQFIPLIEDRINEGRCIFLLDGFDEVHIQKRKEMFQAIEKFCQEYITPKGRGIQNRIIVTSRSLCLSNDIFTQHKWLHMELLEMDYNEREELIRTFIEEYKKFDHNAQLNWYSIKDQLNQKEEMNRIAQNKLMLMAILCMIIQDESNDFQKLKSWKVVERLTRVLSNMDRRSDLDKIGVHNIIENSHPDIFRKYGLSIENVNNAISDFSFIYWLKTLISTRDNAAEIKLPEVSYDIFINLLRLNNKKIDDNKLEEACKEVLCKIGLFDYNNDKKLITIYSFWFSSFKTGLFFKEQEIDIETRPFDKSYISIVYEAYKEKIRIILNALDIDINKILFEETFKKTIEDTKKYRENKVDFRIIDEEDNYNLAKDHDLIKLRIIIPLNCIHKQEIYYAFIFGACLLDSGHNEAKGVKFIRAIRRIMLIDDQNFDMRYAFVLIHLLNECEPYNNIAFNDIQDDIQKAVKNYKISLRDKYNFYKELGVISDFRIPLIYKYIAQNPSDQFKDWLTEIGRDLPEFKLGCIPRNSEKCKYCPLNENKLRKGKIKKSFNISKYPITVSQYEQFIKSGGYDFTKDWWNEDEEGRNWLQSIKRSNFKSRCNEYEWEKISQELGINKRNYKDFQIDKELLFIKYFKPLNWWEQLECKNAPVVNICWYEAKAFAKWAGMMLPTRYQWEIAENIQSPDSKDDSICKEIERIQKIKEKENEKQRAKSFPYLCKYLDFYINNYDYSFIAPVGMFEPKNDIYDMRGLVWEYTDSNADEIFKPEPYEIPKILIKGGAFNSDVYFQLHPYYNVKIGKEDCKCNNIGFRLVDCNSDDDLFDWINDEG